MELALRTALILAMAWTIARLLSRATAATRHLVWHLAVIAVLAAPILAPVTPKFTVPELPGVPHVTGVPRLREVVAVPQPTAQGPRKPGRFATSTAGTPGKSGTLDTLATLGTMAWATGSGVLTLWFALGWLASALAVRRAQPAPASWQVEVNALRERLRITREVKVRVSACGMSPIVAGLWRPVILMPEAARGWSNDRRHSVLLHELAHIRRGDLRVQVLAHAAIAAYWFNPLVWIASSHLRSERERASDDEVLRTGTQPSTYASHLLDTARELQPSFRPSAALAMARPTELEGRLLAVLAGGRVRVPARATRWVIATMATVTTTAALGATPSSMATTRADQRASFAHQPKTRGFSVFAQDGQLPAERLAAERAVKQSSGALASADAQTRERAVMEIAATGQPETIRPLETALADASADVREKAALGLGLMSSANAIPGLLKALTDPDAQVREKAALGLALRRDSRAAEALIAAMADPDAQVREKAAIALGTSGDPRAGAALERALRDPDSQVREKAVTGLLLLRGTTVDETQGDQAREGLRSLIGALLSFAR